MSLRDKKVLITAGPTWVPIDSVRVISNIATGQTGVLLAQEAHKAGARVTLLLGPGETPCLDKNIRVLRFKFFDELKSILMCELRAKKYDCLIHSAAVADYRSAKKITYKIKSGLKSLTLKLVPTPKLVDSIKEIAPSLLVVAFKFEPGLNKARLISKSKALLRRAALDLVVANSTRNGNYLGYIVSEFDVSGPIPSKNKLAAALIKRIGEFNAGV